MNVLTGVHIAAGSLALIPGAAAVAVRKGTVLHIRAAPAADATQRIGRHLWRMCFAFFIATGSFFLGQQDVMPELIRGSPFLFIPAFAPFALMAFWLVRIRWLPPIGSSTGTATVQP